ncbi:uncharacterized protein LOC116169197 [Photinus pyralis]|uniref:uncharacterized protein LOC116169197 n=1 Tax=Photinus pyralis TaxID=7054 RepID=UPI0012676232|nr:uncharacterized protein LOC116169197 [Photinus pyralis]
MRTTTTAAMETLSNLPPLHLVVRAEALRGAYRLRVNGEERSSRVGHSLIFDEISRHKTLGMISERITKTVCLTKLFKTAIPTRSDWEDNSSKIKLNGIVYYTDGSKTKEGTGCGVYGSNGQGCRISVSLGQKATVLQAEVYAILTAASRLLKENFNRKKIFIVTDSKAAIAALNSYVVDSGLVLECTEVLNALGRLNTVTLVWAPGHAGIAGNQVADELARAASAIPLVGPEPACGITYNTAKKEIQAKLTKEHCRHWSEIPGQSHSKIFLETPNEGLASSILKLSRMKIKLATEMATGHCCLNKHLHNMGLTDSPLCRGCGEESETPHHVICLCEAYTKARERLLGNEKITQEEVAKIHPTKILDFIKDTGILEG